MRFEVAGKAAIRDELMFIGGKCSILPLEARNEERAMRENYAP
jgi:hypothetical protein